MLLAGTLSIVHSTSFFMEDCQEERKLEKKATLSFLNMDGEVGPS